MKRRSTLKKHSKSSQRSEPTLKRTKARGPVQRDAKEVLAEVLGKLTGKTGWAGGVDERKRKTQEKHSWPQSRSADGGSGSGGPREPIRQALVNNVGFK